MFVDHRNLSLHFYKKVKIIKCERIDRTAVFKGGKSHENAGSCTARTCHKSFYRFGATRMYDVHYTVFSLTLSQKSVRRYDEDDESFL